MITPVLLVLYSALNSVAGKCENFRQTGPWKVGNGPVIRTSNGIVCGGRNATVQPSSDLTCQFSARNPGCAVTNVDGDVPVFAFRSVNVTGDSASVQNIYDIVEDTLGVQTDPTQLGWNFTFASGSIGFCPNSSEAGWTTLSLDVNCTTGVASGCPGLKEADGDPVSQNNVTVNVCIPPSPMKGYQPADGLRGLGNFHNSSVQEALHTKSQLLPVGSTAARPATASTWLVLPSALVALVGMTNL